MEKLEQNDKQSCLDYADLIELYYFEALRHKRPVVERAFEKNLINVAQKMLEILSEHELVTTNQYSDKELAIGKADAALAGYFKDFHYSLTKMLSEKEFKADELMNKINAFIMYVHERLKKGLGEEMLGISEEQLRALNFIDISRPLDKQEEIILEKSELDNYN